MSWYYCSGCGPSVKCDVCGATECGQDMKLSCPGCCAAKALKQKPVPWNFQLIPKGTRPWKHLRKRETRIRRHSRKVWKTGCVADFRRWKRVHGRWVRNEVFDIL